MLTEEQIERAIERATDTLDRVFMSGGMTQAEYNGELQLLEQWASDAYRSLAMVARMKGAKS